MVQAIRGAVADDKYAQFVKLSTDAERFAFLWSEPSILDVILMEPEFTGKSAENARTHREKVHQLYLQCKLCHCYVVVSL